MTIRRTMILLAGLLCIAATSNADEIDVTAVSAIAPGVQDAIPDDGLDDSDAFEFAGAAAGTNTVLVPAGVYDIIAPEPDDTLYIQQVYAPQHGAILRPHAGVVIQLRGAITAGPWQICDESLGGRCTLSPHREQKVDRIYAEWWGAIGGDSGEDTLAVQRALDEGARSGIVAGMPTYYRVCGLTVPGNVTWVGTNLVVSDPPEQHSTSYEATDGCNQDVATLQGASIILRNIGVNGNRDNNTSGSCIRVVNGLWMSMESVDASRCAESGVVIEVGNNARLDNVLARSNGGHGLYFTDGGDNVLVSNLTSERNDGAGVLLEGSSGERVLTLISPWFEDNATAIDHASSSTCLSVFSAYESHSAIAGVRIRPAARCTTIDTMRFVTGQTPQLGKLVVEAGSGGTVIRNVRADAIVDQSAHHHTMVVARQSDGTLTLTGVQLVQTVGLQQGWLAVAVLMAGVAALRRMRAEAGA